MVRRQAMNRLYAVEGVYSLTGAMADHRLRLESRQIAPFLAALAARLAPSAAGAASLAGAGVAGVDPRWIDALAKDLLANRGQGLIVAGERQPAAVHAAVCALNTSLGNTGKTVSYYETKDAALPSVSSLASLVSAMNAGAIKTLVVLGGNPVFDAPANLDFASAMAKVPHRSRSGTGRRNIHQGDVAYPRAHYLESWGDARAVGGTVASPSRSSSPCSGDEAPLKCWDCSSGTRIVPVTTSCVRPGNRSWESDEFKKWNRVLHDGLLAGSELPQSFPVKREALCGYSAAPPKHSAKAGLAIVFLPSASLHHGRFANNGWLQEFPNPVTKLT